MCSSDLIQQRYSKFIAFLEKADLSVASPFKVAVTLAHPITARFWFSNPSIPVALYYAWALKDFNSTFEANPKEIAQQIIQAGTTGISGEQGLPNAEDIMCQVFNNQGDVCKKTCMPSFIDSSVASIAASAFSMGAGGAMAGFMMGPVAGVIGAALGIGGSLARSITKRDEEVQKCQAEQHECINPGVIHCDG